MSHLPPYIPDYQRLRELAERVPGLDPDDVTAAALLRAVAAELSAQLQLSLDRFGISEGRLRVLSYILYLGDAATHSQLAEAAMVTKGTVTGLVDGLERDKLVRRFPSSGDRRVSLIDLTPAGRRLLDEILPEHLRRLSELMRGVTPAERKTLTRLLEKVRSGLDAPRGAADKASGENA